MSKLCRNSNGIFINVIENVSFEVPKSNTRQITFQCEKLSGLQRQYVLTGDIIVQLVYPTSLGSTCIQRTM